MSETEKPIKVSVTAPPASEDLSRAVDQAVEKFPGEDARTVRLFGDLYRCNWWVNLKSMDWLSVATSRISRSKFLRVTKDAEKLVIVDMGERRTQPQ
jgi:hypothetical protein